MPASFDDDLAAIGALQEPTRRLLYRYVISQRVEVSRDEAAEGIGTSRALAAFHLDKLVEAGLLQATFRRLTGRTGPGAGRPAKLYRRSASEHAVSLPPRMYDLAAEVLARVVEEGGNEPAAEAVTRASHRVGQELGEHAAGRADGRLTRQRRMRLLSETLDHFGYEPHSEGRIIRLANCPFRVLAQNHRDLVCGMNLALLKGLLRGMAAPDLEAYADLQPGECCVTVAPRRRRT